MNAPVLARIRSVELFERPVTLRLPFRFGAATVTHCPQAFVRVQVECSGKRFEGAGAELMVPKWFDKRPTLTHEQNFEQLRESLRCAAEAYRCADLASAHAISEHGGAQAQAAARARGLPRLVAQFGTALLDKAVADAVLLGAGAPWVDGVAAGLLGDPYGPTVALAQPAQVAVRHTVGLADKLGDEPADELALLPGDGLPATLAAAISHYGLRYFKLKLSGRADADHERLARIAAQLDRLAGDYRVTLDGNESFADPDSLAAFWSGASADAALAGLMPRVLLLEQPLARQLALEQDISRLGIGVPVILDESDDAPEAFERGLALGYRGISSKACKGIYRSLQNACRVAREPRRLLLSGEDLTCQAGLAVQQDTLLAATLGVTHIERNGHHYVDGFGLAPDDEAQAFARALPDFYDRRGGRPRLRIEEGRLALSALLAQPGFAAPVRPAWDALRALG